MGLIISPESNWGKELAKWNGPYVFKRYPVMLYRARRRPDGKMSCGEVEDRLCVPKELVAAPGIAEAWTAQCQMIVHSEHEELRAKDQGWRDSPEEALRYQEKLDEAVADAAAHRNWEDRNMSEPAKREALEADPPDSMEHKPEIPEAPRRNQDVQARNAQAKR